MTDLSNLGHKTLLITGATGALGSAFAQLAHTAKARLILIAPSQSKLESLVDRLESDDAIIWPLDFKTTNTQMLESGVNEITQTVESIDYVIHTAALLGQQSPLTQYNPQTWQEVMNVNAHMPFFLTQYLMPYLNKRLSRIAFVDDPSTKGKPYWGAYGASKFLIAQLVEIINQEESINSGIETRLLSPLPFQSKLRKNAFPGSSASLEANPLEEAERLLLSLLK